MTSPVTGSADTSGWGESHEAGGVFLSRKVPYTVGKLRTYIHIYLRTGTILKTSQFKSNLRGIRPSTTNKSVGLLLVFIIPAELTVILVFE